MNDRPVATQERRKTATAPRLARLRTFPDWALEIASGALLLSAIIPTAVWFITSARGDATGDMAGLVLLAILAGAVVVAAFLSFTLIREPAARFVPPPPSPLSRRLFALDAPQEALYISYKRWLKLAFLLGAVPPVWAILAFEMTGSVTPWVWFWPLWGVVLAGSRVMFRKNDRLRPHLPYFTVDWFFEVLIAFLTLLTAGLMANAWSAVPPFAPNRENVATFIMLGVPAIFMFVSLLSMHSTLRGFFTPGAWRANHETAVPWKFRLSRSLFACNVLIWVLVRTIGVIQWYEPYLVPGSGPEVHAGLAAFVNANLPDVLFAVLVLGAVIVYLVLNGREATLLPVGATDSPMR